MHKNIEPRKSAAHEEPAGRRTEQTILFDVVGAAVRHRDCFGWTVQKGFIVPFFRLALRYFSAPAGSVESERVFSATGIIASKRRNSLKGSSVEKLVFLRYNMLKLNFTY